MNKELSSLELEIKRLKADGLSAGEIAKRFNEKGLKTTKLNIDFNKDHIYQMISKIRAKEGTTQKIGMSRTIPLLPLNDKHYKSPPRMITLTEPEPRQENKMIAVMGSPEEIGKILQNWMK